jgi:L-alanine-DL-glutamate epimerase-like enolase superfamily enzyme
VDGIDAGAYRIADGFAHVPDRPGFGLELDNALYDTIRDRQGWTARR